MWRVLFVFLLGCATTPASNEPAPVPYRSEWTRPGFNQAELTRGIYTRSIIEAGIEGLLTIKCDVMASGKVRNCNQLKPLPRLGDAMVERLERTRMEPARRNGEPVSISYVFHFSFHPD
jgi:TonB family protein